MSNGEDGVFPASGFAGRGQILGFNVRCLSPEVQVLCHAHGYVPKEKDLRDMELLEARSALNCPRNCGVKRDVLLANHNQVDSATTVPQGM